MTVSTKQEKYNYFTIILFICCESVIDGPKIDSV